MNNENLIKVRDLTPNERRKNGRKGGIASGKARREKQQLRAVAAAVLDNRYEINGEELSGTELLCKKFIEVLDNTNHKDWLKTVILLAQLTDSTITESELALREEKNAHELTNVKNEIQLDFTDILSALSE